VTSINLVTPGPPKTSDPIVKVGQNYNGNLLIQDIRFSGIPGSDPNASLINQTSGTNTYCVDPTSSNPKQIVSCTSYLADLVLTAYTGFSDPSVAVSALLNITKGQRKLVQYFPVGVTVNSAGKVMSCGARFVSAISPQICFGLGKPNYNPNPTGSLPQPWCQ
jgi:hypothetical protein